ncbi:Rho GTPase activation protein [Suillus fuscotomentosus]|uniref:Rho GTPase activation protein n=1 Tax=Suillus fuscotomentosus TaxID=1912939 RepID=A0AAD4E4R7_9AGAM|nr:Rho GTPase activation protein [Suillus fuscotomentosus]KAG1899236.1 Rho GTPase activation protein [Suillus fuscotomentosus]
MSEISDSTQSTQSTGTSGCPREFLVSVELYVPTVASFGLRKPVVSRRKADTSKTEETPRSLKEKSSWISVSRSPASAGQWRPATCKLMDEDESCSLNIYVDETILYQTIYIHMLNQFDIRHADSSLFLRKNCLALASAGQRWGSPTNTEPIYFQFEDADTCSTWLVLLRSYSKPEIYGQTFASRDGGLYRMWRQVELSILQGRNLGNHFKAQLDTNASSGILSEGDPREADPIDLDAFCEIHLNDNICARTTVKKGIGSPDWLENFSFPDLPPFETLEVTVWREKRLLKPVLLGSVRIALTNFRRSEAVEGWFPVIQAGGASNSIQVGEIRMKLTVDEEIILPHNSYSGLLTVLRDRNVLEWMSDFERRLHLRTTSYQLMCIAIAKNILVEHITEYADREVDGTPSSHNTIFRGNTTFTKTMELAMAFYGKAFLESSIGCTIRRICSEKVAIEVDPVRSGKGAKEVERGVDQLIHWSQEVWNQIYAVRGQCPNELRRLFEHVRKLVEKHYHTKDSQDPHNRELPWQSVSAFCFLRFIVPGILNPHLFGLYPGLPSARIQRSLTLIAKVIQSLANLNPNVQKEEFMRGMKDFLKQNLPAMVDYILVVSTPIPSDPCSPHSGHPAHSHQRLNVVSSLHERSTTMPVLERESIPLLPHVLDIPRHLARITSSVLRSARSADPKDKSSEGDNPHLSGLCAQCFDLEDQSLARVSQLAGVESCAVALKWDVPRITSTVSSAAPSSPASPSKMVESRKVSRPYTASSLSDLSEVDHRKASSGDMTPSSPVSHYLSSLRRGSVPDIPSSPKVTSSPEERSTRAINRPRFLRPKSISADSISSLASPASAQSLRGPPEFRDLEASGKRKNVLQGLLTKR